MPQPFTQQSARPDRIQFRKQYRTTPGSTSFEQDVCRFELDHEIGLEMDLQPKLTGDLIEARPLQRDDFDALYKAAGDPLIWEHTRSPTAIGEKSFRNFSTRRSNPVERLL
jgi:hypothetical protein